MDIGVPSYGSLIFTKLNNLNCSVNILPERARTANEPNLCNKTAVHCIAHEQTIISTYFSWLARPIS